MKIQILASYNCLNEKNSNSDVVDNETINEMYVR